ncbi:DinB family protein [Pinibacter aurantiacus]|uniref:DinB family protein n=1 Tax=Pinibacter aurantiacus TaxID=2851599 RepID=A0A9E2SBN6_9BACT|nr:DinB family protein [Pinibacter aurantiacus]MBV4358387.1 DinB family protein [Pinibacter aurantiacus]
MKSLLLLLIFPVLFGSFTTYNKKGLTDAERKFAVDLLSKTKNDLVSAVQGLSDAQLNFKQAPDRWSVLECVQHITLSSKGIFDSQQKLAKAPNDSAFKSSFTDEQFVGMIEDRSHKAQAPEPFKPVNSPYKTLDATLAEFNKDRDDLIKYVQGTDEDLRNHVAKLPFGKADAYQMVLLIAAHTNRHTQQLNEVKADPNFPKQ